MPLIQSGSKKALKKNIETEMKSNPSPKDRAQNLAIAYSVQRKNKKAFGGKIDEHMVEKHESEHADDAKSEPRPTGKAFGGELYEKHAELSKDFDELLAKHDHNAVMEYMAGRFMAHGGMPYEGSMDEDFPEIEADEMMHEDSEDEMLPDSIADAVMAKRKKYADGGMVDLEKNSEEDKNNEDDLSYEAILKEQYDLSQLDEQPHDSNEHGDELEDADEHDMVSSVRKKMRSLKR